MIIHAVLGNPNHPEYGVVTIPFPIPHDQYAHCIVQPHDTGQRTGAFYCQPVVEHLDLDIRPFDAVIAVFNGVDNQLFPGKLRVFRLGDKASICAEVGAFLDLATHELQRFLNDLQNASLKHHVFRMLDQKEESY